MVCVLLLSYENLLYYKFIFKLHAYVYAIYFQMYNLNFPCVPLLPRKKIVAITYDSTLVIIKVHINK